MKTFIPSDTTHVINEPTYADIKTRFLWKKFGCIVELKDGETMIRLKGELVTEADPQNPTRIKVRDYGGESRFIILPYVPPGKPYMVLTLAKFIELIEGAKLIE